MVEKNNTTAVPAMVTRRAPIGYGTTYGRVVPYYYGSRAISHNTFLYTGASAIATWGSTKGSHPLQPEGTGPDGTGGDFPRYTLIDSNFIRFLVSPTPTQRAKASKPRRLSLTCMLASLPLAQLLFQRHERSCVSAGHPREAVVMPVPGQDCAEHRQKQSLL